MAKSRITASRQISAGFSPRSDSPSSPTTTLLILYVSNNDFLSTIRSRENFKISSQKETHKIIIHPSIYVKNFKKRKVTIESFVEIKIHLNSGANKGARRGSGAHRCSGEERETGTWLPAGTSPGLQSKPTSALRPSDPLSRAPHQPQRYCTINCA